jgi:hypothetical protein
VLNKFGEELYSAVEAALASGAQDLGRALDASQDDDNAQFLRELLDKWNKRHSDVHGQNICPHKQEDANPRTRSPPVARHRDSL